MDKQKQIAIAVAVVILVAIAILAIFLLTGGGNEGATTTAPPPPPGGIEVGSPAFSPQPPSPAPSMAPAPSAPSAPAKVAIRPRPDPFAPLPEEVEAMQGEAFNPNQVFILASPPEPPKVELPEPYEPQPRRRVAGIIIGPNVSAILEQEGEPTPMIVQPGDMVGEFRVVSISTDGLILRRPTGNPREVRVPYEPPSTGITSGGAGAPGGAPGGFGAPTPPGFGAPAPPRFGPAGGPRGGGGGLDI